MRGRSIILLPVLITSYGPNYYSALDAMFPVWAWRPHYRPDRSGD